MYTRRKYLNYRSGLCQEAQKNILMMPQVELIFLDTLNSGDQGGLTLSGHITYFRFDNRHNFRYIGNSDTMSSTAYRQHEKQAEAPNCPPSFRKSPRRSLKPTADTKQRTMPRELPPTPKPAGNLTLPIQYAYIMHRKPRFNPSL